MSDPYNVVQLLLDTGETPLFTRRHRIALGRCVRCEWHTETQGHHPHCPDADYCTCATDHRDEAPADSASTEGETAS